MSWTRGLLLATLAGSLAWSPAALAGEGKQHGETAAKECPQHEAKGAQAMGGCPMMKDLTQAANIRVEDSPNGAIMRFEAKGGGADAIIDARKAAVELAERMNASCPHEMKAQQKAAQEKAPSEG